MAMNGSLDDYSPAGALRVLSSTGRTGAVRFTGSAGCTAYLHEGQLYFARGDDTDDALASALVRPGRLSADAWTRAVELAGDEPRVGELLIEHGPIDPDLLASVVLSVIYDPLITLFREGDGRFDFEPDTMHWIGPYRGFNVEAIVNEVRRRVRNVDEMSDVVPSISAWVSPARTLPDGAAQVTLQREDWELITSLSGPRTVTELATAMGRGRYSTAQVVNRLARAGLLEVVPEPFGPNDALYEPSAAERIAAAEDAASGDAPVTEAPVAEPPVTDELIADVPEADDAAWEAFTSGNPFDHPPADEVDSPGVSFGPSLNGVSVGPEGAPAADDELLPRRTVVAEREIDDREIDGHEIDGHEIGEADDDSPALAGITGFHNPTAAVIERQDETMAAATDPDLDPNAAWLENLYAQFIDDDGGDGNKFRRREALDVAFQAPEQDTSEKVGTLKRLAAALRRL